MVPILFGLAVFMGAAARDDYSHVSQFMSELAARGSPNATLMSSVAVMTGLGFGAFAFCLYHLGTSKGAGILSSLLMGISAMGLFMTGVFPCDLGCPTVGGSLSQVIHNQSAFSAFIVGIPLPAVVSWGQRKIAGANFYVIYSWTTSLIMAAVLGVMLALGVDSGVVGLLQRLFIGAYFLWVLVTGARALSSHRAK